MGALLVVSLLLGCHNFTDLEEACHDRVPGGQHVDPGQELRGVWRINCYRRLVNLPRINVHKQVQAAADRHVSYLGRNRASLVTGLDYFIQQPGRVGYSGTDIRERVKAEGYDFDTTYVDWGIWEAIWIDDFSDAVERIDFWAYDPYSREVFLQPAEVDSAFAVTGWNEEGGKQPPYLSYLNIFFEHPAAQRVERPIVYPKDEQVNVPTRFVMDNPLDPLCGQELGFPITVTVGSEEALESFDSGGNPYGLYFTAVALHGPGGAIELDVREPGDGKVPGDSLVYTAAAIPLEPLEVGVQYRFDARIRWNAADKEISTTFRTGPGDRPYFGEGEFTPYCVDTTSTSSSTPFAPGTTDETDPGSGRMDGELERPWVRTRWAQQPVREGVRE